MCCKLLQTQKTNIAKLFLLCLGGLPAMLQVHKRIFATKFTVISCYKRLHLIANSFKKENHFVQIYFTSILNREDSNLSTYSLLLS